MSSGGLRSSGYFKKSIASHPLISIITIVYNGDAYLEETILSVINQSYQNFEYIIVDGGSTDNSLNIIKMYEDRIDYWLSEKDKGVSDAFNKGIKLCRGELIGIINADDWYESNIFEEVSKVIEPNSIIHGDIKMWEINQTEPIRIIPNHNFLYKEMTINHPSVFINKALYHKYGLFKKNYKFSMDYELLYRFKQNKVNFIYLDKVVSNMRRGGISSNWLACYRETRNAKIENGASYLSSNLIMIWQIIRRVLSNSMNKIGMARIVKFYRSKFSIMKNL